MKAKVLFSVAVAAIAASCSSQQNSTEAVPENEQAKEIINIQGEWNIDSIVVDESETVYPAKEDPETRQYILFEDSTYAVHTNCNTISGWYTLDGDSIVIGDGMMTMMACENMATEDALRKILPAVVTITVENDTTARLNTSTPDSYIELSRAAVQE
ncbi:MAG: META domain-containing protein [Muribaculaceae bacterium]|nr:META domain-containing protein [Muribaculaceae bacterium]